ncbi:MAG: MerR family DNA-binding transcriptional regulator [Myxococcales bacterium]|nr:MerR family DNA-binding transcriptional regulator [Myxococcales bacterium]
MPTTEEIARHVGVTPQTVRDWGKKGLLPTPKKAHRGRRGTALVWPEGTEVQAAWVQQKLEEGLTVRDVVEALARGDFNKPTS